MNIGTPDIQSTIVFMSFSDEIAVISLLVSEFNEYILVLFFTKKLLFTSIQQLS